MGYRVHTYSPDYDTPTGQVADVEVSASYHDLDAIRSFAEGVDVITFEFENVPASAAAAAAEKALVRPSGEVLHITQNRLREKTFLATNGFPVTRFERVTSLDELQRVSGSIPNAIVKTAGWGYDGKGQTRIDAKSNLADAWSSLATDEAIVEALVDFECEMSVIVARGASGETATFDVTRNEHSRHILDVSSVPSQLPPDVTRRAREIAAALAEKLELIGLLCIEMFYTKSGEVLINELAPRPHNSGHWTFDGCVTSQFEQQLRAVCGLPLGDTAMLRPAAAMANLLGDIWNGGAPKWDRALEDSDIKLHLYGKSEPRPGRKMGHLTVLADTPDEAVQRVVAARNRLG
jgi:5-(carboxyamino)imidazole ribonucleotide synthase